MAMRWLNDGKPGPDGFLILTIDPEDGTRPMKVRGKTLEEVVTKLGKTVEHGTRHISELRAQLSALLPPASKSDSKPANGAATPQQQEPHKLTAAEQLAATANLSHPSKAADAVVTLFEHATGIDVEEMRRQETMKRISAIQMAWENKHPDFPSHPTNYKLLTATAASRVGYENITESVMDAVYAELLAEGYLVPAAAPEEEPPPNSSVPPEETPATSTTVRPRKAGSYSSRDLRATAPPPASKTPAYTRAQVAAMTSAELQRKMETEPGFAELIAEYSTGTTTRANA